VGFLGITADHILDWYYFNYILEARPVLQSSPFFLSYEKPVFLFLWAVWPLGHLLLAGAIGAYCWVLFSANDAYRKHVSENNGPAVIAKVLLWASGGLAIFLMFGTLGGAAYEEYVAAERTYASAVQSTVPAPPRNARPGTGIDQRRLNVIIKELRDAAYDVRNKRGWIKFASIFLVIFIIVWLISLRYFFFALAYRRALSKPHLPTDIVDRALSGGRIDQHALANAFTQSTAPVVHDSLADKVDRERLAALAARLQTDTSALDNKLSKETEIARLVVDHARKRAELADMEKTLRDMGVKRNG